MALSFGAGGTGVPVAPTAEDVSAPNVCGLESVPADHFVQRDGQTFAGTHLIVDLWDASRLDDVGHMEAVLRTIVDRCQATLLHIHLHHFSPTGISGVAVLAESHISVHTWPERGYAAFDVFMCGAAQPELAIDILRQSFSASRVDVKEIRRGILAGDYESMA